MNSARIEELEALSVNLDEGLKVALTVNEQHLSGTAETIRQLERAEAERDNLIAERTTVSKIVGGTYAVGALPIYLRSIVDEYHRFEAQLSTLRLACQERARGAYGAEASWFSAKAETYQNIENRLDEILDGQVEQSPWKAIDSAPKDGTRVWLWWPHWSKERAILGSYLPASRLNQHGRWEAPEVLYRDGPQPELWQPYNPPAPPVAGDETKEE